MSDPEWWETNDNGGSGGQGDDSTPRQKQMRKKKWAPVIIVIGLVGGLALGWFGADYFIGSNELEYDSSVRYMDTIDGVSVESGYSYFVLTVAFHNHTNHTMSTYPGYWTFSIENTKYTPLDLTYTSSLSTGSQNVGKDGKGTMTSIYKISDSLAYAGYTYTLSYNDGERDSFNWIKNDNLLP